MRRACGVRVAGFRKLLLILATFCGALFASGINAAEPSSEAAPSIRRLFVPEGQPRLWPPGDWRPWRLKDFEQRLNALQPAPLPTDRAVISRASYRGVLADGQLRGGRFELQVQRTGSAAAPLSLDLWNMPITSLNWKASANSKDTSTSALWGTDPLSRTILVVVDRPAGTLEGTWALAGRRLPQGREFSLQFPPASATQIELQLPADRILQCAQGDVTGPVAATEPGWSRWQVELGSRSQAQLLVTTRSSPPPAPGTVAASKLSRPLIIARREMVCAIRQEVTRLQADFHLEILEAPVRELVFQPSQDLKVIGVALGDNTPLSWTESVKPEGRLLKVSLPDPLEGPGIVLRVQALATPQVQQSWNLPQLRLMDAVPIDGQITLNVAPPLELDDLQFPIGSYRQTALVTSPTDGESIVLRQLQPRGDARILLSWPRWKAHCRMLTQVQASGREWTSTTQFEWSATSGSAFAVRCALPPDWTVVDVREPESESAGAGIGWELLRPTSGSGPAVLRVEFRDALSPEHPRQVRVLCRTPAVELRKRVALPLFVPQGAQDVPISDAESFLSISTDTSASAVFEPGNQVEAATAAELPSDAASDAFWKTAPAGSFPGGLLLKSRNAAVAKGQFLLQSARDLADVQASVRALVSRQRIVETYRLRITPRNLPLKRVLAYLSEASPQTEVMEWGLAGETQHRLEAQRLEPSAHAAWNVPETGALWEVRLPAAAEGEFTLVGKRTRTMKSRDRISLVYVPHANLFEGRVEVEHHPRLLLQIEPRNLDPVAEPSEDSARRSAPDDLRRTVWRYRDLSAELDYRVAQDREMAAPLVVSEMDVTPRLALETEGTDLYWASFRISPLVESLAPSAPLRWTLPADAILLQVTRDGTRLIPEQSGAQYLVFPTDRRRSQTVLVQYRVPTMAHFGPNRRDISLPEIPHSVLRFNLQLLVPESVRVDGRLGNLRFSEPVEPPGSWRQALFGPWARPARTKPFDPSNPGEWTRGWPSLFSTADEGVAHDSFGLNLSEASTSPESAIVGAVPAGMFPADVTSRGWRVWRLTSPVPLTNGHVVLWSRAEVWHSCWLLLLLTLLLGSVIRARSGRTTDAPRQKSVFGKWAIITVTVAVFLSASLPGIAFEMAASVCLGLLIVSLLPQSWLARRTQPLPTAPRVPGGSTRSFAQPSALLGLWLLTSAACSVVAEENIPATVRSKPFDILIPVNQQGQPAGKNPLVYVPPALHDRLLQPPPDLRVLPDSLLTSAEYVGQIDAQQPFTVVARYQVAVLSRQAEVRVPFSFRGGNLGGDGACLVDGKPHSVLSNSAGDGCVLLLPGLNDDAKRSASSPNPAADGEFSARQFSVEFRLHPQVAARGNNGSLRVAEVGVPPVLSAVGTLTSGKSYPWLTVHETGVVATTQSSPQKPGEPLKNMLGRATSLTWEWSELPQVAAPAAVIQWRFSTVVDVDLRLLQLRCQAQGKILDGTLSSVRWTLPAGTAVRSLQATDLLEHHLETRAAGHLDLWMTFKSPRTDDFSIQAALVYPVESHEGMLTIPSLPVPVCGDVSGAVPKVALYQLALRPPADFRMMPPKAARPALLHERSTEEFQREQPLDASRVVSAWLLDEPQPLSVELEVLRPRLNVSSSTIYRLQRDRIDVSFEADIDTLTAPGFRYRLQIDPRLQISSISVMEEGVERLLRWNPAPNNQALVFLNDRTTRAQKLLLMGHLPLSGPGKIELPQTQLVYADVLQNRFSIYHDAGWNVQLENQSHFHSLPPEPTEQFPAGREIPLGRFEFPAKSGKITAVVEKNVPALKVDRLFVLNTQDRPWKLSAKLRLEVERGRGSEFEIVVPREWSPGSEFHSDPPGRYVSKLLPDGFQQLLISPEEPISAGNSCTVTLKLPTFPRTGLNWTLPEIRVPNSRTGASYIVTQSRGPAVKVSGQRFERLDAAALPPPIRTLIPEPPSGTEWLGAFAGNSPVRLQIPSATAASAKLRRVILLETQIVPAAAGLQGRQLYWLPPESAEQLDFDWPAGLEFLAALVDGSAASPTQPQSGRLSIPLHPGLAGQTVLLAWKAIGIHPVVPENPSGLARAWGVSADLTIPLPRLRDSIVETELIEVLPNETLRLQSAAGHSTVSRGILALDRWDALLRWQAAQMSDNVSDELIDATDQFLERTAIDAERVLKSDRVKDGTRNVQRIEELRKRTGDFLPESAIGEFQRPSLIPPAPLETPPPLTVCWLPGQVPLGSVLLVEKTKQDSAPDADAAMASNELRIHYATGGLFPWLLGIITAVLCGWLAAWLRRRHVLSAIQSRTWLACTLLGTVWWLVLMGSGWGFMLLIGGLLTGVMTFFRRPAAKSS